MPETPPAAQPPEIIGSDAAVAVGRFDPDGPTGYRSKAGGPIRATREEAENDYREGRPDYTVETVPGDCRFFEGDDGVLIAVITHEDHVEAHCHGPWEHFREDGGCEHMDAMVAAQKPGRDFRVVPFGGRSCGCTREGWVTDENGPGYKVIHEEGCPNG